MHSLPVPHRPGGLRNEIPLHRVRRGHGIRGAAAPGRRDARRRLQLRDVPARDGDAHQSDGDAARELDGGEDRGREVRAQPLEATRSGLEGGHGEAFKEAERPAGRRPPPVEWSPEAVERLGRVPGFVRGMVKRIYTDYAREREIRTLTPEVMDTARAELGLEGM